MARLERPVSKSSNPATKFIEWKSNDKCFSFYDKDKQTNTPIELPFKFLFLEHYHTVKGWHGATDKGIYSNEIYAMTEELTVKTFGGLEVAKGVYKDIKEKVNAAGGKYVRSIYIMLEDGTMANLQLKGAVVGGLKKEQAVSKKDVQGYSEFYKEQKHLLDNQWIEVNSFEDAKKGATKYSIPVFTVGEPISREADANANKVVAILQDYMNDYFGKKKPVEAIEVITDDDLDF